MRRSLVCLATLAACLACAAASGGGGRGYRPSLITAEEIETTSARNAYEAVELLRRQWLISRGSVSLQDPRPRLPLAYQNDLRLGELERLREIPVDEIQEIRFIDGATAVTRYGMEHGGGVIQVITRP